MYDRTLWDTLDISRNSPAAAEYVAMSPPEIQGESHRRSSSVSPEKEMKALQIGGVQATKSSLKYIILEKSRSYSAPKWVVIQICYFAQNLLFLHHAGIQYTNNVNYNIL